MKLCTQVIPLLFSLHLGDYIITMWCLLYIINNAMLLSPPAKFVLTHWRSMTPISCSSLTRTKMHICHIPHKLCFTLIHVDAKIVLIRLSFELLFRSPVTTHNHSCFIINSCERSFCILNTSKHHLIISLTHNLFLYLT